MVVHTRPSSEVFDNINNVFGVAKSMSTTGTVTFLGKFDKLDECGEADLESWPLGMCTYAVTSPNGGLFAGHRACLLQVFVRRCQVHGLYLAPS